jgi:two-component system sensor histidine kinase/response regulator
MSEASSPPAVPARLYIVDDEGKQVEALCRTLTLEGYDAKGFTSSVAALDALRTQSAHVLLTDLMMPQLDGIALIESAHKLDPHLAAVVMTGHGTIDTAVKALQTGALDYIQKPFSLNALLPVLTRALAMRRLRIENEELAARLNERTLELERANLGLTAANKELEAFSYSVSHDLRAPLRAVHGFAEIFQEDFCPARPPEGRELIGKVLDGARRMDQLIDDLLALSRSARQPLRHARIDVEGLARRVAARLAPPAAERSVEVVIGSMPDCEGDASLLEQVFMNLLANAFKFTRGRADARIEVGHGVEDGEAAYFVRDNGAGFDPKQAFRLFGVFQRLHRASDFEGTGVGLSIVQRIVARHGGRIWAHGKPGDGATFFFTLPAARQG